MTLLAADEPDRDDPARARRIAPASVMAGSLLVLLPVVATVPVLPPFGLLMLLAWRLTRLDALRVWGIAPLGFFDDLVSGQPVGSATLLWPLCMMMVDVIDTRLVQRDFWLDWLIACGAIGACLVGGRVFAGMLHAHVDTAMLVQLAASAALFPLAVRLCTRLDPRHGR